MEWIDEIVLGLIDMYGTDNIYEICDYLNIQIIKLDIDNKLLHGNDAFYCREYFGIEIIFVRNDLPLEYEKFALAHEVGHALLHTNILTAAFNKDLIVAGKLEKQANYFAFKFNQIKFNEIEMYQMTVSQIASYLELPEKALKQLIDTI